MPSTRVADRARCSNVPAIPACRRIESRRSITRGRRVARGALFAGCAAVLSLTVAGCPGLPASLNLGRFDAGPDLLGTFSVTEQLNEASAFAPTPDGRILFTERVTGRVRVINAQGNLEEFPAIDFPVNSAGTSGLLGLALDPDFATNGRVFAFLSLSNTAADTTDPAAIVDHRVVSFVLDGNVADGGETLVLSVPAAMASERIGGRIGFNDDDGNLYVATGDLEQPDQVQDAATLNGKLLRLNADGSIPADNPSPDSPVFARGLRDPQGLAFDTLTAQIYLIDEQPDQRSEINTVAAEGNLGWPLITGLVDTSEEAAASLSGAISPMLLSASGTPFRGLSVNNSGRFGPGVSGELFAGDGRQSGVRRFELNASRTAILSEADFADNVLFPVVDITFTDGGRLFALSTGNLVEILPIFGA